MVLKPLVLSVFSVICMLSSTAQLNKGSLWVGGSITYGSALYEVKNVQEPAATAKQTGLSLYVGKSIRENIVIGILFSYGRNRDKYISPPIHGDNQFSYGAGIFLRNYKFLGKGFYLFGEGQLEYNYLKNHHIYSIDPVEFYKTKIHGGGLYFYPGVSYAVNKSIHMEARLGNLFGISYSYEKKHVESPVFKERDERIPRFNVSTALNDISSGASFGFRFLLNQKKLQ
jgi:hypothetical protein